MPTKAIALDSQRSATSSSQRSDRKLKKGKKKASLAKKTPSSVLNTIPDEAEDLTAADETALNIPYAQSQAKAQESEGNERLSASLHSYKPHWHRTLWTGQLDMLQAGRREAKWLVVVDPIVALT